MRLMVIGLAAAIVLTLSAIVRAQVPDGPLLLRASFVNLTAAGASTKHVMEITIDKYSTSNDKVEMIDAMVKGGQDALLARMQRMPFKGRMRIPGWTGPDPNGYKVGWELRYIWREAMPDSGTRVVLGTDRPLKLAEALEDARTVGFPFTSSKSTSRRPARERAGPTGRHGGCSTRTPNRSSSRSFRRRR